MYSCHKFLDKNRDSLSPGKRTFPSWCRLPIDNRMYKTLWSSCTIAADAMSSIHAACHMM